MSHLWQLSSTAEVPNGLLKNGTTHEWIWPRQMRNFCRVSVQPAAWARNGKGVAAYIRQTRWRAVSELKLSCYALSGETLTKFVLWGGLFSGLALIGRSSCPSKAPSNPSTLTGEIHAVFCGKVFCKSSLDCIAVRHIWGNQPSRRSHFNTA